MHSSFKLTAPPDVYCRRRARLAESLKRPLAIFAGEPRGRQYASNTHPFRAGSSYLYFGGPPLPGSVWLIEPGSDGESGSTLFRPPSSFDDEVWTGPAVSDESIALCAGVKADSLRVPDKLKQCLGGRSGGFVAPPCPATTHWSAELGLKSASSDELQPIIDLRLNLDEHELGAMRRAASAGVKAHMAAMKATKPGRTEAEVAAAFHAGLMSCGCYPSFTPIVTVRGEIFHNESYVNTLKAGQLMLVDGGAEEVGGYASDITRTFPTSGSFTPLQRQLYDTVARAKSSAIDACVPGKRYREVHDIAASVISEGLVEAELLRGDPAELAARRAHTLFFPHGVGHLIGLDVHDMEDFGDQAGYAEGRQRRPGFGDKWLRLDRDLKAGMVVTIEPGIYIVPAIWGNAELVTPFEDVVNRKAVDALINEEFGGIRLEDDIHVRSVQDGGPENLTAALPTNADEVLSIIT